MSCPIGRPVASLNTVEHRSAQALHRPPRDKTVPHFRCWISHTRGEAQR
jgi:hypothetical protein